jgi:two-component system response regulator MprA
MRLLVVEDDPALAASLQRVLEFEGYDVVYAGSGETAMAILTKEAFDSAIIDVGLPGISGLELTRRLRGSGDRTPVLMLTARQLTGDRVAGLDAGADDYVVKPFELEELLARVRALLRRSRAEEPGGAALEVADLRLDALSHEVWRGDREVALTHKEFALLYVLMRHPRQVLDRAQLWNEVWGMDFDPGSNTVDVFVGYLRRKLEADGEERLIHTVRGTGYVLKPPRP